MSKRRKEAKAAKKAAGGSKSDGTDIKISERSVTGVYSSRTRDIQVENFSLQANGMQLIQDTQLTLNYGRRYGLIGANGCGKSTLLTCIGEREVDIPESQDIYHLTREIEASEKTALEAVLEDINSTIAKLEERSEELLKTDEGAQSDELQDIYERLEELDVASAPRRAGKILHGLGFDKRMQAKMTKDFSGGWRMRIALAKALFVSPMVLLLDEPTNHLDLEACVWLEEYLKTYTRILVLVSHSQDFLNNVCTNIMVLEGGRLHYYSGNYDVYMQSRAEREENQMKQYNWEQDQIRHMKEYIARFGHGSAKLARQAQSKEKVLAKMEAAGLTEAVVAQSRFSFKFPDPGTLPIPVLQISDVTFGYSPDRLLYEKLDFGVDLESRIALVGPNGAGKSTLLKLMLGECVPLDGMVKRNSHLRLGWYHQHLAEHLDLELSPVEWMMRCFPDNCKTIEDARGGIGRFGITGNTQTNKMALMSDGQRSRICFAWLAWQKPHILLLDEPTNHLDMETIDALAQAVNGFEGGVVLVSHDFRLINAVAKEIWICDDKTVTRWTQDIQMYKDALKARVLGELSDA